MPLSRIWKALEVVIADRCAASSLRLEQGGEIKAPPGSNGQDETRPGAVGSPSVTKRRVWGSRASPALTFNPTAPC